MGEQRGFRDLHRWLYCLRGVEYSRTRFLNHLTRLFPATVMHDGNEENGAAPGGITILAGARRNEGA